MQRVRSRASHQRYVLLAVPSDGSNLMQRLFLCVMPALALSCSTLRRVEPNATAPTRGGLARDCALALPSDGSNIMQRCSMVSCCTPLSSCSPLRPVDPNATPHIRHTPTYIFVMQY